MIKKLKLCKNVMKLLVVLMVAIKVWCLTCNTYSIRPEGQRLENILSKMMIIK